MKKPARNSITLLIVQYFLLLLLSLLWGWSLQNIVILNSLDNYLYTLVYLGPHFPVIELLSRPFNYNLLFHVPRLPEDLPTFFYFMIAGTALYLWFRKREYLGWFLGSVVLGNILVHFISLVDIQLLFRTRPFLALNLPMDPIGFKSWKDLSSFPSGHCRDTALYSTLIALFVPKLRWVAGILIVFIAFIRVYLGAHYPSDVIVGTAIGMGVAFLIWKAVLLLKSTRHNL